MILIVLFVTVALGIALVWMWMNRTMTPSVNPVTPVNPVTGAPPVTTATPTTGVAGVSVVGPVLGVEGAMMAPPDTYPVNLGPSNIFIPVNTILLEEAPPAVRAELLTAIPNDPLEGVNVPDTFDARNQWPGLISDPLHQGSCGSCWAFSTAMSVSDRFRIAQPQNQDLRVRFMYRPFVPGVQYPVINVISPYYLVSCDTCEGFEAALPIAQDYLAGTDDQCEMGCRGGFLQTVHKYLQLRGAPSLYAAPTSCNMAVQACPCPETQALMYRPSRVYSVVSAGDSPEMKRRKIMEDIYQKGPVAAGFKVYQSLYDFLSRNPTGVYTTRDQPVGDRYIGGHAVGIVGWGTDQGVFYWLIRNSWGMASGANGYFRMQWDFGGILDNVMAADP